MPGVGVDDSADNGVVAAADNAIFAAIVIAAAAAPADIMCVLRAIADGLAACKACSDVVFDGIREGDFCKEGGHSASTEIVAVVAVPVVFFFRNSFLASCSSPLCICTAARNRLTSGIDRSLNFDSGEIQYES
jgi:hypothetical protein